MLNDYKMEIDVSELEKMSQVNVIDSENQGVFGDDQEEMYFDAANWLRLALSLEPNNPEANFLLGVFYQQGLSVDVNNELAF